jgi:hypothetical protein
MKTNALILALLLPSTAFAEGTRELGAHVHGHSTLNIAIEEGQVAMELEAPGVDIVGFEHRAETEADQARLDAAIGQLSQPLALFVLPAAAACTVTSSDVSLPTETGAGHDGHAEFHAQYPLDCADPGAIDRIEFAFFELFPNAREVEVQMISDKGSQVFEVERDAPLLDLAGLI